jgi:hypothetical protein
MRTLLIVSLLTLTCAAQEHSSQLPHPNDSITVPIKDAGKEDAPVKIGGNAYAYAKTLNKQVYTWVEDLDLTVENVSGKTIKHIYLETWLTDQRGWLEDHDRDLVWGVKDFTGKLISKPLFQSGEIWHQPFAHVHVTINPVSLEEFNNTPKVEPLDRTHAVLVEFTDGSPPYTEDSFAKQQQQQQQ